MKKEKIAVLVLVVAAVAAAVWFLARGGKSSGSAYLSTEDGGSDGGTVTKWANGIGYVFDSAGNFVRILQTAKTKGQSQQVASGAQSDTTFYPYNS